MTVCFFNISLKTTPSSSRPSFLLSISRLLHSFQPFPHFLFSLFSIPPLSLSFTFFSPLFLFSPDFSPDFLPCLICLLLCPFSPFLFTPSSFSSLSIPSLPFYLSPAFNSIYPPSFSSFSLFILFPFTLFSRLLRSSPALFRHPPSYFP